MRRIENILPRQGVEGIPCRNFFLDHLFSSFKKQRTFTIIDTGESVIRGEVKV